MILEGALNELMKDVRGNKTMDVGTREIVCKRLFIRCEFTTKLTALRKHIPQDHL